LSVPAFVSYFRGYLTITVTGRFCERFLNRCTSKGILLWDINKISEHAIRCKIPVSAFKELPPIVRGTGICVHINIKHGFPFFLQRYKKRKIALLGIFIFLTVVTVFNQFVWDIEITGNHKVTEEEIISVLNESGLKIGMPISNIDQQELKKDALLSIPELAWLWVDKRGSRVIVDVREKIEVPEMFFADDYTNIIAAKDAIIESMTVRAGVPVVNVGDTVLAGTVLVTGKIPMPARQIDSYTRADAQVFARVWYEKREIFSKISTTKHETGRRKNQYTLEFFGKKIPVFHDGKAPFDEFDVSDTHYSFWGIGFSKKTYEEISLSEEILTEESVVDFATAQLMQQLEEEVEADSILKNRDISYNALNDTTIEVCVKAEYLEDIAVAEKTNPPSGVELE